MDPGLNYKSNVAMSIFYAILLNVDKIPGQVHGKVANDISFLFKLYLTRQVS